MKLYVQSGVLKYDDSREQEDLVIADSVKSKLWKLNESSGEVKFEETHDPENNPVFVDEDDDSRAYELIVSDGVLYMAELVPEGLGGCICDRIQDMLDDHRAKCVVQVAAIVENSEKDVMEFAAKNGKKINIIP